MKKRHEGDELTIYIWFLDSNKIDKWWLLCIETEVEATNRFCHCSCCGFDSNLGLVSHLGRALPSFSCNGFFLIIEYSAEIEYTLFTLGRILRNTVDIVLSTIEFFQLKKAIDYLIYLSFFYINNYLFYYLGLFKENYLYQTISV